MEHGLTFSMLGVRVAEMKAGWLDNQNDLLAAIIQVGSYLMKMENCERNKTADE